MNLLLAHIDLVAFAFGKNSKNMFRLLPSVGAIAFDFDPASAVEHYEEYIQVLLCQRIYCSFPPYFYPCRIAFHTELFACV